MSNCFGWLSSADNFMPHGHCFLWQPTTLWLNVGSDALIAASYFAIPLALYYFLISLHGGTVQARSAGLGQGSEYTIYLPGSIVIVKRANTALEPADLPVANGARCKVLIVDDNRDSADALALVLEFDGYEVATGYSGTEALQLAAREHPDAVILDIGMPDLTGYEMPSKPASVSRSLSLAGDQTFGEFARTVTRGEHYGWGVGSSNEFIE